MVRPYAIKGHKRKKREENYDREEVEQLLEEETAATATQDEKKAEEVSLELPGIPLVPSNLNNKTGVTFILERACLEVAKVGKVNKFYFFSCYFYSCIINSFCLTYPKKNKNHFAYLFIKNCPPPFSIHLLKQVCV